MILNVDVVNKIATFQKRGGNIVCGNSDYLIQFSFDREWDAHDEKTARFISNGQFTDVDFSKTKDNNTCAVPILYDTPEVEVGVYAGKLKTTTSAVIKCNRSILCELVTPSEENDRTYANEAKEAADRAELAAEEAAEKVGASTNEAATRAEEAAGRAESAAEDVANTIGAATNEATARAEAAAKVAEDAAGRAEIDSGGISKEVDRRLTALENDTAPRFTTDKTLSLTNGVLSVNTVDDMYDNTADKTLPITASAVEVTVGNISALLDII